MLRNLLVLTLALVAATAAHAEGGLLSLLGQASQSQGAGASTAATTGTTPPASGGGFSLDRLRGLFNIPKVEISAAEKEKLERLKSMLWSLSGPNEKFCYGDLDDIVYQLRDELGQRVDQEISNRAAAEASRGIFPRIRGRIVNRVVSRNYGSYFSMGMNEANGRVRSGLQQFLRETGCNVNVPDRCSESRGLTLAKLEQFAADAPVLRDISQRAEALGLPGFTFPNGMGWRDIDAIMNTRIPPNGVMKPRAQQRASTN